MNVAQLKEVIADLPDDMPVVFRPWGSWAQPIAGIHILPYDKHRRLIADGEEAPPVHGTGTRAQPVPSSVTQETNPDDGGLHLHLFSKRPV